ncbi:hypothetical protein [Mariniblastus fucicola]|uniref:Carboxypeptidase regulatory-like domain-containing protein n=1 Tax=Mariniblastus fucicola TaxID=980251 RepID=A0A5B9P6E9_9BACT|nr:hypothetical protein [Mariniblastus fucicola]QEG21109.1 hypothetical protein MFFC18_09620 [Mariniblastus fucicola]
MNIHYGFTKATILLLLIGICSTGCLSGEKLEKAGGIVMVDGRPSSAGTIEFYPVSGGRTANAVIQDDGTFTISYRKPGDGLPPGDYKVAVIVDKVLNSTPKMSAEEDGDGNFTPEFRQGAVTHIVPQIYNNIQTTPLRYTIDNTGESQHLEIEISTSD